LRSRGKAGVIPDLVTLCMHSRQGLHWRLRSDDDECCATYQETLVYPPREDLVLYLLDFIRQHDRECTNSTCGDCGMQDLDWAAALFSAKYPELLEMYHEVKGRFEVPPTPNNNPDKYWQVASPPPPPRLAADLSS
jgi:hypothetical protein